MDREHEGNPFPPNTEGKPRHLLHSRSSSFLMNRIWHFSTVWEGRCEMARSVTHYPWEQLAGQIVPEVLQAPKTGGDPNGGWPTVHEHVVGYLVRSVVGTRLCKSSGPAGRRARSTSTRCTNGEVGSADAPCSLQGTFFSAWAPDHGRMGTGPVSSTLHAGGSPPQRWPKRSSSVFGTLQQCDQTGLGMA